MNLPSTTASSTLPAPIPFRTSSSSHHQKRRNRKSSSWKCYAVVRGVCCFVPIALASPKASLRKAAPSLKKMLKCAAENIKGFVASRPPVVLFLIFLTSVAATLLSLTLYLENNEIRDPSVDLDWNLFLQNFANVDFCVSSSSNGTFFPSFNVSLASGEIGKKALKDRNRLVSGKLLSESSKGPLANEEIKNFSINVLLVIHPTYDFLGKSDNLTHLSGSVTGKQLGFQGDEDGASQAILDVSFELGRNRSLKESLCNNKGFLVGRRCPDIVMPTCAHVTGPASLFPATSRAPSSCVASTPSSSRGVNGSYVETHARITAHRELVSSGWGAAPFCLMGPVAHTKYKLDPALTVFLGVDDRSVINLHLLHTSYFLFVMVATVLVYAACKSHGKTQGVNGVNKSHHHPSNLTGTSSNNSSSSAACDGADHRGNYALVG